MIRFIPDSLRDAVWRPLAMAAPEGGVYVEIIAPDFRFVFIAFLLSLLIVLGRLRQALRPPVGWLLVLLAAAFVPWLATTGNGRYFIAFLLLPGPIGAALAHRLPMKPTKKLAVVALMLAWQGYQIVEVSPWRSWGLLTWREPPAFGVQVPSELARSPATYITLSNISYSLVAPSFHPDSSWINLSADVALAGHSPDGERVRDRIASARVLRVLFPSPPSGVRSVELEPALAIAINDLLARWTLSIEAPERCQWLPSRGLAGMAENRQRVGRAEAGEQYGFWTCTLVRRASEETRQRVAAPEWMENVFSAMERMCPRIFRGGEAVTLRIPAGGVRAYPSSDFRLYVLDNGQVYYKYYRALNAVEVGKADDILTGKVRMDCGNIRGRAGLPWERQI